MKKMLMLLVLGGGAICYAAQQSSVSQYGMTFTFDKAYEVGTFANGDYWVKGPLTITSITPNVVTDGTGLHHGWEVNPKVTGSQGFDQRAGNFSASLIPSLPYSASGGESIVKTISFEITSSSCRPCVRTAAVLTVVDEIPPDAGASVFRPPYVGTDKPYFSINDLRTELLPSLDPVPLATSDDWGNVKLQWVTDRYKKVQLDHKGGGTGRIIHPEEHMPNYGGDIGSNNGDAVLRLCLNEPLAQKMPGLIGFVQYGIDIHHMVYIGQTWPGGGGHRPGQLLPLAFAALMLDDAKMKTNLQGPTDTLILHEIKTMFWSEKQQRALYGYYQGSGGDDYWNRLATQSSGAKSMRDIYDYIDGGYAPGGNYQGCCTSQPWKGEGLSFMLIPELFGIWNNRTFFDYVDRWVTFGVVTQPDPCAPVSQGGGHDPNTDFCMHDPDLEYFNSPTDFKCKAGAKCGRFPDLHGTSPDGGGRYSRFQAEMWDKYRSTADIGDRYQDSKRTRLSDKTLFTLSPHPFDLKSRYMAIGWKKPSNQPMTVTIYNHQGQEVKRLFNNNPAGVIWGGMDRQGKLVVPGVYYLKIVSGTEKAISNFLVIK